MSKLPGAVLTGWLRRDGAWRSFFGHPSQPQSGEIGRAWTL